MTNTNARGSRPRLRLNPAAVAFASLVIGACSINGHCHWSLVISPRGQSPPFQGPRHDRRLHDSLLLLGLARRHPILLHLLSSVRAQEMSFPTLRFHARQHGKDRPPPPAGELVLLLVRTVLLGLLALAVAGRCSRPPPAYGRTAVRGRAHRGQLLLHGSRGPAARPASTRPAARPAACWAGPPKPTLAALLLTNSARRVGVRRRPGQGTGPGHRPGRPAQRAWPTPAWPAAGRPCPSRSPRPLNLLKKQAVAQKAVYVFTDLQKISFDGLAALPQLKDAGIQLMLSIAPAVSPPTTSASPTLQIAGRRSSSGPEFTATLVQLRPTDRVVEVWLQNRRPPGGRARRQGPQGRRQGRGPRAVRFFHRFPRPARTSAKSPSATATTWPSTTSAVSPWTSPSASGPCSSAAKIASAGRSTRPACCTWPWTPTPGRPRPGRSSCRPCRPASSATPR